MILARVDPVTLAINLSLIIGAILIGSVLFVLGMVAVTGLRAWLFTRRQQKSQSEYDAVFTAEKQGRLREQSDPLVRRPR